MHSQKKRRENQMFASVILISADGLGLLFIKLKAFCLDMTQKRIHTLINILRIKNLLKETIN